MKRLTDFVTAENVREWWNLQRHDSRSQLKLSEKMLANVTPEMEELVFTIADLFGAEVGEVGAVVQYLDAAIQMRTKVQ